MGVEPGTIIAGRFRVLSELGRGGMAVVYLAEDRASPGPPVALKLVPPAHEDDDVSLRRFRREAETLAKLRHPNILELLDSGQTEAGGLWLSMPRLEGEDLDRRLQRGPMAIEEALRIARAIALALVHAHERGVVHRDLKPSNIFLDARTSPPTPRVLDFGISRVFNDPALTRITSTGRTLGSPGYMSPEQIRGADLDGRSDLYGLGILLFQMLTGRLPLPTQGDMFEVLRAHLERRSPRLSEVAPERSFEPALEQLVASMLEKHAKNRPASAAAVVAQLDALGTEITTEAPVAAPVEASARKPSPLTLLFTAALGAGVALVVVVLLRGATVETAASSIRPQAAAPLAPSPRPKPIAEAESPPPVERAPTVDPAPPSTSPSAPPEAPAPRAELVRGRPRRLEVTRAGPAEPTPVARPSAMPLPNDARLRENIDKLRDGPTPDERTAARATLLSLFRSTIAELPEASQPGLSKDLAGLAAAGSADGFSRFHDRVRAAWVRGGAE